MMLSESQERMLMVLTPEKEPQAEAVFRKWGLDFAIIGKTTDTLRFVVKHHGEVKADLPIKELGDEAPRYDRPHIATPKRAPIFAEAVNPPVANSEALLRLIGSANGAAKRWIFEQYDHLILGNTVQAPGGDAAVVRIGEGPKGLALTTDVNEFYCEADPFEGGKQAVAEAWRNLSVVGALPLAVTDNLNFGNPEKPDVMGQLVGAIEGIAAACTALDFPVVSGNVSLYNESPSGAILPTPSIGGVGLVDDVSQTQSFAFKRAGDAILLIGETRGHLGQSAYLREICGREEGAPPPVDLAIEKRNGDFVRSLVRHGKVSAAHDLGDGGLALGLAKMAIAGGIGAQIAASVDLAAHGFLFGEDQARYVLTAAPNEATAIEAAAQAAGVPCRAIGTTGGAALTIEGEAAIVLADLTRRFEAWLPDFMRGGAH
jgi:phosphoribosylformylglycinamidine synthase subunit PurL